MRSKEFPHAPLERIAKKASNKRISKPAVKALRNFVLENAEGKGKEIADLARHAGRRTVMKNDVVFVTKKHSE
jgi:histone H3/H4